MSKWTGGVGNQVHPMIQTYLTFLNNKAVFQDDDAPPFTQRKLFSHGRRSTKVNTFPGHHSHHISTLLNYSGPFWMTTTLKWPCIQSRTSQLLFSGENYFIFLQSDWTGSFVTNIERETCISDLTHKWECWKPWPFIWYLCDREDRSHSH